GAWCCRPWRPSTWARRGPRAAAVRPEPPRSSAPTGRPTTRASRAAGARRESWSTSLARVREDRVYASGHRRVLLGHSHLERRAVGDCAAAREPHRRVGPEPFLGALPAEHARLQAHAVTRGQHDVLPDFQILRRLEQIAFLAHDRPRAVALEHVHRDGPERRATLGVEDERLLGLELPAHAPGLLLDVRLLDSEVGARGDRAGRLGRWYPALGDQRSGHGQDEDGDHSKNRCRHKSCSHRSVDSKGKSDRNAISIPRYHILRPGKSSNTLKTIRSSPEGYRACG